MSHWPALDEQGAFWPLDQLSSIKFLSSLLSAHALWKIQTILHIRHISWLEEQNVTRRNWSVCNRVDKPHLCFVSVQHGTLNSFTSVIEGGIQGSWGNPTIISRLLPCSDAKDSIGEALRSKAPLTPRALLYLHNDDMNHLYNILINN